MSGFCLVRGAGLSIKVWVDTFGRTITEKINQENNKYASHGVGVNWGISLGVVGSHHF